MAEFKNELILQDASGVKVSIDLRNALVMGSAPTTATKARVGMQAYVVSGGAITEEYVCTAVSGGVYTWILREISGGMVDVDATLTQSGMAADAKAVGDAIDELKRTTGGLNSTSAALLVTILRSAVYDTDQSANIDALEIALSEGGLPDTPDTPDVPSVETLPLAVVLGNVSRSDGVKLTYDTTSSSAAIRASINPVAVYVESGKTYKIAISNYSTYGIAMQLMTYSAKDTDFTVVGGTQRIINGDFTRTYTSGWRHEDIVFTADGTADIFIVMMAKGSAHNEALTTDDITALNSMLTVTVE